MPHCQAKSGSTMKANLKWLALILLVSTLFFWKILLTRQFSLLEFPESVNQAYSWYNFCATTLQQGSLPLWDPFTNAGRTFVGGMETAVFYPLKLLLYLWPLNRSHLLSPQLFHDCRVLTHILAAYLLFLLVRELGLGCFPAFVASLCFSFGGFLSKIVWPDMLDTAIWLPLILLFLIRAWRHSETGLTILHSCLSGLALGMTILAGRIHLVIMDVLVVTGAVVYLGVAERKNASPTPCVRSSWARVACIITIIGTTAFAFGAVQLLPSIEYSRIAVRYIGTADSPVQAASRIPYSDLSDALKPQSFMGFLFPVAFPGGSIGGEGFSPYFGILPLLLALLGVWGNWDNLWVRYLAAVAILSFFMTLGPYSFLHGLAYALVPYLWMVRNAGRYIYLTHFAAAVLAGFGVRTLLSTRDSDRKTLASFSRALKWLVIALALVLGAPAVIGKIEINDWAYFSFLLLLGSFALLAHILRGYATSATRFIAVGLILCDLQVNFWIIENRVSRQQAGTDYLDQALYSRNVADFLKKQPGLFRARMSTARPLNIGDLYGVPITECSMATELEDYMHFRTRVVRAPDLLNVQYTVRASSAGEPDPIYSDRLWKVYRNPSACPRAWIVHRVTVEPSQQKTLSLLNETAFDPLKSAIISSSLSPALDAQAEGLQEEVRFDSYRPNRLEMTVRAGSRGLLVLSEVDFPGWQATVNGAESPIHKVDGLLRGVIVSGGESRIVFRYAPSSILIGGILTICAPLSTAAVGVCLWRSRKKRMLLSAAAAPGEI